MRLSRVVTIAVVSYVAVPARAEVDWSRGFVTAHGLGVADRHAPAPASAREASRRAAEDAARAKLATAVLALPLARGGTVKAKASAGPVKARLDAAVASARTLAFTPHTDGSWEVTLGVPIEAIRQALTGPRTLAGDDRDPPVVVVEGVKARPAIGVAIGGIEGAVLWTKEVPDWAKSAPRIAAIGGKPGAIDVATKQGGPSTLFVVLVK